MPTMTDARRPELPVPAQDGQNGTYRDGGARQRWWGRARRFGLRTP
jgi:hypothetical protein